MGNQFLTMEHTKKWYRAEHIFPTVSDRETYDSWAGLGKKTTAERALDEVRRRLEPGVENLPRRSVRNALKEIMHREAEKAGFKDLPDIAKYY
jgi:trimethylamine:corrinoid methyltransferase-like protein